MLKAIFYNKYNLTIVEEKWKSERWYIDILRYRITLDITVQSIFCSIFARTILLNTDVLKRKINVSISESIDKKTYVIRPNFLYLF